MVTGSRITSRIFCEFIDHLAAGYNRRIVLITDRYLVHLSKATESHVVELEGRVLLYVIPEYDEKLNPAHHLWAWRKRQKLE